MAGGVGEGDGAAVGDELEGADAFGGGGGGVAGNREGAAEEAEGGGSPRRSGRFTVVLVSWSVWPRSKQGGAGGRAVVEEECRWTRRRRWGRCRCWRGECDVDGAEDEVVADDGALDAEALGGVDGADPERGGAGW